MMLFFGLPVVIASAKVCDAYTSIMRAVSEPDRIPASKTTPSQVRCTAYLCML